MTVDGAETLSLQLVHPRRQCYPSSLHPSLSDFQDSPGTDAVVSSENAPEVGGPSAV